jgi:hypothetical protein
MLIAIVLQRHKIMLGQLENYSLFVQGMFTKWITERRNRILKTPAFSYSGGPGFKSRRGDRLS